MDIEQPEARNEVQLSKEFKMNRTNLLKEYYQKYFPFDKVCQWLGHVDSRENSSLNSHDYFNRREISYVIPSSFEDDEFVVRHISYSKPEKFKSDVLEKIPIRIDIGAVFEQEPSKNKDILQKEKNNALDREYVIDIDMNDYDKIRTCCTGKKLCPLCWKFMTLAYRVLKKALEQNLGLSKILWVFSGRRGIHAWVCDDRARFMRNDVRAAVTQYLNLSVSNDSSDNLVLKVVRESLVENSDGSYQFNNPFFK